MLVLHRMRKYFTIFVLLMPFLLSGQSVMPGQSEYGFENESKADSLQFNESDVENFIKENKMKFRMAAGAFAGTSFGSGEYFGTYISPQVNYRLSQRFSLTAGMTLTNTFGNPWSYHPTEAVIGYPSANFTRSFLYASGAYQLSERLVISGTVYKEINMFNQASFSANNSAGDYHGMIMGVDYKIGKNVFIQGQIEISNNPYRNYYQPGFYNNSFGNRAFGSPFPY